MLKNLKGSPLPSFTVSGIVRFFKRNNFRVKIGFSHAQHAISDFLKKKDRCFFYATFFEICFTEALPQFLPETNRFARVKDSLLKVFGTMRLTGDRQKYFRKISKKNFPQFSVF